ncbi:histone acetyltransferase KAT2B-like isoform X4 [Vanacampus margaritifer]
MRGSTVTACIFHQCVVFCVFLPAGGGRVQVQRLEESEPAGHASAQRAAAARRRQPAPALPQLLARFGCESLTSRINVSRDHVWLLLCLAGDHVSHQERVPEDEVNRLLDVEYLYTCVDKEEDADTKQVYFSLFKLLRKCILQMGKPTLEAQESPPFKRPGIEQHQTIAELAKMSLNQINFWQPETPSQGLQRLPNHDQQAKLPPEKRTLILTHFPKF